MHCDLGKWGQTLQMSTCIVVRGRTRASALPNPHIEWKRSGRSCMLCSRMPLVLVWEISRLPLRGGNVVSPKWLRDGQAKLQARWKMCLIDMLPEDSVD